MFGRVFFALVCLLGCVLEIRAKLTCKDNDGNPVDWFVGYKLPELKQNSDPLVKQGYGFLYFDVNNPGTWTKLSVSLKQKTHAVAYTLQEIYDSKDQTDVVYMMYNDENPNGPTSTTKGHTKGALIFDSTSGYWLVHSVPKFPPANAYDYPQTGRTYGQSFLCVTFSYKMLRTIGQQLMFYEPYIYASKIADSIASENPELAKVLTGHSAQTAPFNQSQTLKSLGGVTFRSFAKHKKWAKELYADFLAPSLGSVYTETWQNGPGDLPTDCNGDNSTSVYNVKALKLPFGTTFENGNDHSKWAISTTSASQHFVCIGDINRQSTQAHRSGGTVCFSNEPTWQSYSTAVADFEPCPVGSRTRSRTSGR